MGGQAASLRPVSASRTILHVDMDAFFASVEARDDPSLRGLPLLVGSPGKRGVVAAASYAARRFGCHSAQPMAVALRKCPQARVVRPRHGRYVEVSREVFAIFERFTPLVEGLSIDEAFLDLSGTERLHGPARRAAEQIRAAVHSELGLTCSVGIASCKFIAKIASERDKPDGLTQVPAGEERAFLEPLPVRALWGVGPRTAQTLARYGVETIGDIARLGELTLVRELGEHGRHLHALSLGIDPRPVVPGRERKQVGHENTFEDDLSTRAQIEDWMLQQATRVADRLVAKDLRGRKVQIKLRDVSFTTWTRQATLARPTRDAREIFAAARALLDKLEAEGKLEGGRFRLTGVSVGELVEGKGEGREGGGEQLALLGLGGAAQAEAAAKEQAGEAIQDVLSEVRRRFGGRALRPGGVREDD
nr:DNA polymerase IV [Pseudenhygromyxa sp. WMMC2535]